MALDSTFQWNDTNCVGPIKERHHRALDPVGRQRLTNTRCQFNPAQERRVSEFGDNCEFSGHKNFYKNAALLLELGDNEKIELATFLLLILLSNCKVVQ